MKGITKSNLKIHPKIGVIGVLSGIFLCAILFLVAEVLLFPKYGIFVPDGWLLLGLFLAFSTIIVFSYIFLRTNKQLSKIPRWIQNLTLITVFVSIFCIHLFIGFSLRADPLGWDPAVVENQAINLAKGLPTQYDSYFEGYANNLGVLALLTSFFKFAAAVGVPSLQAASIGFNVLAMEIATVLIFLVCQKLYGRRVALLSLLPSFLLITLSLWTNTTYTDTLTLLFPVLTLLLAIHIHQATQVRTKILYGVLAGVTLAVGFLIKPTVIILPIAILVVLLLKSSLLFYDKKKEARSTVITIAAAISVFYLCYISLLMLINSLSIVPFDAVKGSEKSRPVHHWAMIGLQLSYRDYGRPLYGAYSLEDDVRTAGRTTEETKRVATDTIKKRLADYGPLGYFKYLNDKAVWILSDGTFYAYGEGIAYGGTITSYRDNSVGAEFIRDIFDNHGKYYPILTNLQHAVWLLLLLLIAAQIIFLSRKHALWIYILYVSIAGILLFVLLFEGRSRYLYTYVPVFIIAALYAFYSTEKWLLKK